MRKMAAAALAGLGLAALTFTGSAWAQAATAGSSGTGSTGASALSTPTTPAPGTAAAPGGGSAGGPTEASGAGGPTPQTMTTVGPNETVGRVKDIDRSSNTLTLANGQEVTVSPNAVVMKDGYRASLSDIKRGDDVRASFTPGAQNAQQLEVTSPPGTYQPTP